MELICCFLGKTVVICPLPRYTKPVHTKTCANSTRSDNHMERLYKRRSTTHEYLNCPPREGPYRYAHMYIFIYIYVFVPEPSIYVYIHTCIHILDGGTLSTLGREGKTTRYKQTTRVYDRTLGWSVVSHES